MASGDKPASGTVPPPRQRPAPTIDLKATEIASAPVNPSQPTDSATNMPKDAAPAAAAETAAPPPPRPNADKESSRASDPPKAAAAPRLTPPVPPVSWPVAGAGLIGAAVMLCLFLALWGFGAFGSRDDAGAALTARLATLEAQVRDLANRPQPAGLDQRVFAELAARVGAAEQSVSRLAAAEAGLAKLETAVANPRQPAADPALVARVAALETALRALGELGPRVDALDKAQQKNAGAPASDVAALAARVTALEQAGKAIEARIARAGQAGGADQPGRIAFVAVALRAAAERGDPFAQELAAAKALVPNSTMLAPLEPYAATGLPRPVMLARELSQLVTPILNAAGAPREGGGILDRLQQNAEKLVRIRPISESAGDDPATVVTRAEVKATHGDITGALTELARLPEPARAPAQAWIRKAESQMAALNAARRFAENAVDALAKAEQ